MKKAMQAAEPRRRNFFRRSGAIATGVVTGATMSTLGAHMALAHDEERRGHEVGRRSDYGDLRPTPDEDGNTVLALPRDFRYVTFSKTGEPFGGGLVVPRNHDGMACF